VREFAEAKQMVNCNRFIKINLTKRERLRHLKTAIEYLLQNKIDTYNHDTKTWYREFFDLRDRFDCFLSCLETFALGYVWRVEFE